MAKYLIRPPFAVHLAWFENTEENGVKRKMRREQSYFHSKDPIELNDEDAFMHMHKLEPVDAAAKKLFSDFHDEQSKAIEARQSTEGGNKSLVAQVSEAVIAALVATGVVKPLKSIEGRTPPSS